MSILLSLAFAGTYLGKAVFWAGLGLALIAGVFQNRDHIIGTLKKLSLRSLKHPLPILTVLFIISAGCSSYFGIDPDYSLKQWAKVSALLCLGFVIYGVFRLFPSFNLEKFSTSAFWFVGFFSLWSLIDLLKIWPEFTSFVHGEDLRLSMYSSFIAILVPFCLYYLLKRNSILFWICYIPAIAAVFYLGGRSGWLALGVSLLAFISLFKFHEVVKTSRNLIGFLTSMIVGPALGLWLYQLSIGDQFVSRVTFSSGKGLGTGRLNIWDFSMSHFLEHPILGIGVKAFRKLDFSNIELSSTIHPHNAVIELLLETGILGVSVVSILAGYVLYRYFSFWRWHEEKDERNQVTLIFCAILSFGSASLALASIYNAFWLTPLLILLALFMVKLQEMEKKAL